MVNGKMNPPTSPTTYSDEELFKQLENALEESYDMYGLGTGEAERVDDLIDEVKQRLIHYRDHQSQDSCWGYYADSCNKCKLIGEKKAMKRDGYK
jgi:hypothetical protein